MRYVVQPGDTLFAIARRFGTTVQAILAANRGITNPDIIFVGQIIFIPTGPTPTGTPKPTSTPKPTGTPKPTPKPNGFINYVVQPGDTLSAIARRFNTTVQAIVAANRIPNPDLIFVGQILRIPTGGAIPPTGTPRPTATPSPTTTPRPTATPSPTGTPSPNGNGDNGGIDIGF